MSNDNKTNQKEIFNELTHHFLIAMPINLNDETFSRSVIYLCEHNKNGALGVIINKPSDLSLKILFDRINLPLDRKDLISMPVYEGGPIQNDRGFVLHDSLINSNEQKNKETFNFNYAVSLSILGGLEMTASKDVLEAIAFGAGPKNIMVTLGYSSWESGQLENEINNSYWLIARADPKIIFETPAEQRYEKALSLLGLKPWMLSTQVGHA